MDDLSVLLISVACLLLSWVFARDVKKALASGVATMFLQWPDGYRKSEKPIQYYWLIALYSFGALLMFGFGVISLVSLMLQA